MTEIISERLSKKVSLTKEFVLTKGWCVNCRFASEPFAAPRFEELCAIYHGCVAY